MNFSDYRISLDIHEIGYQHSLTVKRRDTRRRIFASFVEDSKPYIFSEDCRAVFTASKPDGNIVFNDCTIENNVICYHVTEQTVIVPGQVKCEFRLYGDDNALLTSSRFSLLVDDTVYDDDDIVESVTEVSTLTRLVGEATDLIAEVNASLENGEFIPKFEIGTVATLSAGSNATVEITGSADAPVLNFGIPQGDRGQAESLIPDAELSLGSTKPVQNKVITAALNEKAKSEDVNKSLEEVEVKVLANATSLTKKVDKVSGKSLSTNDFTNEYKQKLDGIAEGANKYELGEKAVTAANIADEAKTKYFPVYVLNEWEGETAPYTHTATVPGLLETDRPKVFFVPPEDFNTLEDDQEAFALLYDVESADGAVAFYAKDKPACEFSVMLEVSRI